ncbi:MAG: helix-turn-helix transcriptional regulator [Limnohabitans sp.]
MATTLRTVQRDLHALSLSFPIVGDQSKPTGWSWRADAAVLDIPGMDVHTALTFTLVESYMQKLLPATTLSHMRPWFEHANQVLQAGRSPMACWQDKVRVITKTPSLQSPVIDPQVQAVVYECLMQGQQVQITYQAITKNEPSKSYPVHPLGLVVREQVVYLVCTIKEHTDTRFLALHRVSAAEPLEQAARIPEGFDIDEVAAKNLGILVSDQPMLLEMKVSKLVAKYLEETPLNADQKLSTLDEDWMYLQATVSDSVQIRNWILSLGVEAVVLGPVHLHMDMRAAVQRMNEFY